MPNQVTGVKVTSPLTTTSLIVTWMPNADHVTGYNVYRALSKEGTFTLLNTGGPVFGAIYADGTADQRSHTIYFYKVTALDGASEGVASDPVSLIPISRNDNRQTLSRLGDSLEMTHVNILNQVTYRDGLLLRRGGELVDLYVRKTAGLPCTRPNCFVPERDQPAQPDCPICFGTTYNGGYDKYPGVFVKIKPVTTRLELMGEGVRVYSAPEAWTGTFPYLNNGDIIVRAFNNRRYTVQNKDDIISRGILVRQSFLIDEKLPTEDRAIYALT